MQNAQYSMHYLLWGFSGRLFSSLSQSLRGIMIPVSYGAIFCYDWSFLFAGVFCFQALGDTSVVLKTHGHIHILPEGVMQWTSV
jgi:hypothetical protein